MDAIATDQNIALLKCAILKLDSYPIFSIYHTSHTFSSQNLALIRQLVVDDSQEVSPFHCNGFKPIPEMLISTGWNLNLIIIFITSRASYRRRLLLKRPFRLVLECARLSTATPRPQEHQARLIEKEYGIRVPTSIYLPPSLEPRRLSQGRHDLYLREEERATLPGRRRRHRQWWPWMACSSARRWWHAWWLLYVYPPWCLRNWASIVWVQGNSWRAKSGVR